MHVEICGLEPARFLTAPVLAQQGALQKTKVKLDLLIDMDMFVMVEKSIRVGICHTIPQYVQTCNKYMKGYDKNKKSSYMKYWDLNNLSGQAMFQK